MNRKILFGIIIFAMCIVSLPVPYNNVAKIEAAKKTDSLAGRLISGDIVSSPAKKTIRIGKSFKVKLFAANDSEWEDLAPEEWDELCEENIDSIEFRSTRSSVASVNKVTGKVTGRKKGAAVIKTTINLANGEEATYKTKVYVVK